MAQGKILWRETFQGLAIWAGAAVAVVGMMAGLLWLVSGHAKRGGNGDIASGGRLAANAISVGDCFQDQAGQTTFQYVKAVPCDTPHTAQVFGSFEFATGGQIPSRRQLDATIGPSCQQVSVTTVDPAQEPVGARLGALTPSDSGWLADSQVLCTIVSSTPWTGSVVVK